MAKYTKPLINQNQPVTSPMYCTPSKTKEQPGSEICEPAVNQSMLGFNNDDVDDDGDGDVHDDDYDDADGDDDDGKK